MQSAHTCARVHNTCTHTHNICTHSIHAHPARTHTRTCVQHLCTHMHSIWACAHMHSICVHTGPHARTVHVHAHTECLYIYTHAHTWNERSPFAFEQEVLKTSSRTRCHVMSPADNSRNVSVFHERSLTIVVVSNQYRWLPRCQIWGKRLPDTVSFHSHPARWELSSPWDQ